VTRIQVGSGRRQLQVSYTLPGLRSVTVPLTFPATAQEKFRGCHAGRKGVRSAPRWSPRRAGL